MLNYNDFLKLYTIRSYSNNLYNSIMENLESLIEYSNKDKEKFINLKQKTNSLFKTLSFIPIQSEIEDIKKVYAIICAFGLEYSFGSSDITFGLARVLDEKVSIDSDFSISGEDYKTNKQFCDFLLESYLKSDRRNHTYNFFISVLKKHVESFSDNPHLYIHYYELKAKQRDN